MTRREWAAGVAVVAVLLATAATPQIRADDALSRFLTAGDAKEAGARAAEIVGSGVSFDAAYRRLREGRVYGSAPAGIVRLTNRTSDGIEHHFAVTVPDGYDPTHRYRVRIQLHGGVGMRRDSTPPPNAGGIGALEGDEPQFYIVPFAWDQAPWWSSDQLLNLRDILDQVKRRYNVDENHVVLSGVSDGGTGTYYTAMRDTTAFAAFLPLNGFWGVLAAPDLDVDGPLFPGNLRDKPFFIVNGERDPLYPIALVEPAVAHYRAIGMSLEYWPQAGAGHNTQWWPRVKPRFEDFVRAHPRRPLPDRLTWETADTKIFNRAHWLVVDALGAARGEQILDDPNLVASAPRLEFGVRSIGNRVNAVVPGSNAEQFGLKVGDALVRVNDESVHVSIDIEELFERVKPGTAMTLLVARDNAPVELSGTFNPKSVNDPPHEMFPRGQPSGRVDISRTGNTVTAKTHGVTAFTLLVSPDQFDFAKPIVVVANGTTVFNHRVDPSLATLLQWAAVDNDRTMLFGAEVHITLPRH